MQGSIGIVQMKNVAVTVLLVSHSPPEAADPCRFFPNHVTERYSELKMVSTKLSRMKFVYFWNNKISVLCDVTP